MNRTLTPREKQLRDLILEGSTIQDSAEKLELSISRVKAARSCLFRKYRVRNSDELVALLLLPLDQYHSFTP